MLRRSPASIRLQRGSRDFWMLYQRCADIVIAFNGFTGAISILWIYVVVSCVVSMPIIHKSILYWYMYFTYLTVCTYNVCWYDGVVVRQSLMQSVMFSLVKYCCFNGSLSLDNHCIVTHWKVCIVSLLIGALVIGPKVSITHCIRDKNGILICHCWCCSDTIIFITLFNRLVRCHIALFFTR